MSEAGPVTVLVVDDQAPFRGAARAVLAMTAGFELFGESESGEDAVERIAQAPPDLVLMDINLGGINGIEATRRILAMHPGVKIILVSTYAVDDLPPDARTSGAIAYLHKEELTPAGLRRLWENGGDPQWSGNGNGAGDPASAFG